MKKEGSIFVEIVAWVLIIFAFIIAFIGLFYPIIPSVVFILLGFIIYGVFYDFADLPWWFWVIEILFVVLLFSADTISNLVGVKKFGGSKAGMWGSTIGLLVGPFVLPFAGIILGPFIGAVLAELIFMKRSFKESIFSGIGSVVGFLTSVATKGILQVIMIVIFLFSI